jgi:hypothetical protein
MRASLKDWRGGDEVRLGHFQKFIVLSVLGILKVNGLILQTLWVEDILSFLDLVDLSDLIDLIGLSELSELSDLKMWGFSGLNGLKFAFRFRFDGFDELGGATWLEWGLIMGWRVIVILWCKGVGEYWGCGFGLLVL